MKKCKQCKQCGTSLDDYDQLTVHRKYSRTHHITKRRKYIDFVKCSKCSEEIILDIGIDN